MPDATDLTKAIKKAALKAQESAKPVNICFGTVETTNPLTINVEQKMTLGEKQLVLCRSVTEYTTMATVQWETEQNEQPHKHSIEGTKQMIIHNALEKGEGVILIRQQEGQKYIVIDRIGGGSK